MSQLPAHLLAFKEEDWSSPYSEDEVTEYHDSKGVFPRIDKMYLQWLQSAHGRSLRSAYITNPLTGTKLQLDRAFSFSSRDSLSGDAPLSWRGGVDDIRLDYSVPYLESILPNWEELDDVIPFVGIGVDESTGYNMLCFDYRVEDCLSIAFWWHEDNASDEVITEPFARDFADFVSKTTGQ